MFKHNWGFGRSLWLLGSLILGAVAFSDRLIGRRSKRATASSDGTARVWESTSGTELAVAAGHGGSVTHAAFSPEGDRIVTASLDGTARVWESASGTELAVLEGHTADIVWHATFSPEGDRILTVGGDLSEFFLIQTVVASGPARVWDAASGTELAVLEGDGHRVYHAAFSPEGDRIVTAGRDGTARVYLTELDDVLKVAKSRLPWGHVLRDDNERR